MVKTNDSILFATSHREARQWAAPLAVRMRPHTLDEFLGQHHFLGEGKLLRRLLAADRIGSVIFHGPPGTGKTTLAHLLARESRSVFRQLSAVSDGVKQLREILAEADARLTDNDQKTLLFIDEIHRFNKAQQDVLLPEVENGIVTLVGATTENPFFTINAALLSRSRLFAFELLTPGDIVSLLHRAVADKSRGLGLYNITLDPDAAELLAELADGDARSALSALEIGVLSSLDDDVHKSEVHFTRELAAEAMQRKVIAYDRDGDAHYDTISALIKSIRGSDADAAIYWLAKMLEGGDDVRFLARRLVILASEDVGNADPAALPLAVATAQACELVGLPECQLNLAQCVCYLACAPKSNAATMAIGAARSDVQNRSLVPVPRHLRDTSYRGAKELGHAGYQYAHNAEGAVVAQEYLGVEREYYAPSPRGFEKELGERLQELRAKIRGEYTAPEHPIRARSVSEWPESEHEA
ncbi:MAG: replication-associated recombination protein A [Thermoguttaceae bacterium]